MRTAANRKTSLRDKERMNFRLDAEIKTRVVRAAAITGQKLTDFAVSVLSEKADQVIERHNSIVLSSEETKIFLHALADAKKPSERSLAAARRYRQGRRSGVRLHLDH